MKSLEPVQSVAEWPQEYLEFVRLFNGRHFYDAHEVLEDLWVVEVEPLKGFYKGLIQMAAAFWHLERGKHKSAQRLLDRSDHLLSQLPDRFEGLALHLLREEARAAIHSPFDVQNRNVDHSHVGITPLLELAHGYPAPPP